MAVISVEKLPHNNEAEKAVLGAMLRSTTVLNDAMSSLQVEDFFQLNENHRAIFKAMLALFNEHTPVDAQTVVNQLINNKELDVAGGPEYLLELADSVITFANIKEYIEIVRKQAILRTFLETIDDIQLSYLKNEVDDDFLNIAESKISKVTEKRNIGQFRKANVISEKVSQEMANLKATDDDSAVTGIPTGFPLLNRYTNGFQKGNYVVLAARTGIGKTAFALNLALHAAKRGYAVAYFSLEMRGEELFKRLLSGESNVEYKTILTGWNINQQKRLNVIQACRGLSELPFYVEDTSGINIIDLMAKVRKLKAEVPDLGLVFVDYIGLVTTSGKRKSDSRSMEVQEISINLKKLALELNICIVAVAQLNRKVEERGGEPQLSDLRESGSLEQDADIVLLMYEMKYEKIKSFAKKDDSGYDQLNSMVQTLALKEGGENAKFIYVKVAKNRAGQQGNVPLLFRKNYVKFDTPSTESEASLKQIDEARIELSKGE